MNISIDTSAIKDCRWSDMSVRFFFGGVITVLTGVIGKEFGPVVAGLFLAFPAIFPASATMIEQHEKEKKQKSGIDGTQRGRLLAAVDACGAALGAFGLIAFSLITWRLLPAHSPWLALPLGLLAWMSVAMLLWVARRHMPARRRHHRLR